jgi:hypothetical protein
MAGNFSTLLSTISLPEFSDLVRREWQSRDQFVQRNAKAMYIIDTDMEGKTKLYDEFDTETYADDKAEGQAMAKARVNVGYDKTMTAKVVAKSVDITYEERRQNRYQRVKSKITSLMSLCDNRIDLDLTHRITFATSTSYTDLNGQTVDTTVGDGLALASTVHTLSASSTTYSNRLTGDPAFSQTALQAALLIAASQIYNNFGQRRVINFNAIFCWSDPGTEQAIDQLLNSTADVDAVQAGIVNVYKGKFTKVVLPNLATDANGAYDSTKKRWWGIAAIGQGEMGFQAHYGEWDAPRMTTPQPGNNGENIDTLNWTYATYAMFGSVIVSPKGLIISCPTS